MTMALVLLCGFVLAGKIVLAIRAWRRELMEYGDYDLGAEEEFCYYCAEPLDEDGLCSAQCHESENDEGRDCECESEN